MDRAFVVDRFRVHVVLVVVAVCGFVSHVRLRVCLEILLRSQEQFQVAFLVWVLSFGLLLLVLVILLHVREVEALLEIAEDRVVVVGLVELGVVGLDFGRAYVLNS